MDADTDLFVQAFWVRCREIIRPELDAAVDALRRAGLDAHISTLEFSSHDPITADNAPTLTLTVHTSGAADTRQLRYRGDVASREVEVTASDGKTSRCDLSAVTQAGVKNDIKLCFGSLLN